MSHFLRYRWWIVIAGLFAHSSRGQCGIVPGDIYTSNYSSEIKHYSTAGAYVESISIPSSFGSDVKGLAYGPDNFLYATVGNGTSGFNVVALDQNGSVIQTYSGPEYVNGNLSFGKIAFGSNNQFFVGGQNNLRRFTIGNPTGTVIYSNNQIYDVTLMPSGNLLVLSAYDLKEITPNGAVVRTINPSVALGDARGVAYRAATDDIFVTMLGYTGQSFRVMRLDGQTGNVERNVYYWYADDLFITKDSRLLVGSRTMDVGIFDFDLYQIGSLTGGSQMFVAQAVPEPCSAVLLGISALGGLGFGMLRQRRRHVNNLV
ncbi:MAG: PEP-CTERM sorting domain-containing protein [Gemmataceae bacterium]